MTNPEIPLFVSGILASSYAIAALFFLKVVDKNRRAAS